VAKWADHRKVPQIAFKPDWTRHAKVAPFKRNDAMLDVLPIGVGCSQSLTFRTTSQTRRGSWAFRRSTYGFRTPVGDKVVSQSLAAERLPGHDGAMKERRAP
jgi:hypothetical protein